MMELWNYLIKLNNWRVDLASSFVKNLFLIESKSKFFEFSKNYIRF